VLNCTSGVFRDVLAVNSQVEGYPSGEPKENEGRKKEMLKLGNVGEKKTRHNDWRGSRYVGRRFWIAAQSDSR